MDLDRLSLSQVAQLTGLDRETVTRRLAKMPSERGPRNAKLYSATEALKAAFGIGSEDVDTQLKNEQLRVERSRADKLELELAALKGSLTPTEEVGQEVDRLFTIVRQRLFAVPSRCVHQVVAADRDHAAVFEIIAAEINEALADLSSDQWKPPMENDEHDQTRNSSARDSQENIQAD